MQENEAPKELIPSELKLSFSRSSGPGGQNVNKVNSRVTLHWHVDQSQLIGAEVKTRFYEKYHHRINEEGMLVLHSDRHRDQPRNIEDVKDKLLEMIAQVWLAPKKRKATKPSRAAQQKRLDLKKQHSLKKQGRRLSGF